MKRIITLVLSLIFILQGITVAAAVPANDYARLESFGFIPEGFETKDMSAAATREDLAFMLARLMKVGDMSPIKTQFEDVEETSVYSGYINILNKAGIINGESATRFNPKGSFTLATADRLVVKILGYTGLANNEEQCVNLTTRLQMNRDVQVLDNKAVTNGGLIQFFHNVVEADLPNVTFNDAELTVPVYSISNERSVLGTWLGISAYYGTVDEVNDKDHEATVTITKNKYEANSKKLDAGSSYTFKGAENINLNKYLNVPSILWVDKTGTIIAMEYESDIEVKHGYVFSVDDSETKGDLSTISASKEVMLFNDDTIYKIDSGVRFFYNFEETNSPKQVVGNFAKLVLKNGKIVVMEAFKMTEGGLITSIDGTEIIYTQGTIKGKTLKDFDEASKRLIYIDGESADLRELKDKSVFAYYKDDENFVIAASHKRVIDTFKVKSGNKLQIGNILYKMSNPFYYSNGTVFTKGTNPSVLLNCTVDAYFHPNGELMYILPANDEAIASNKKLGILLGHDQEVFGPEMVYIMFLEPTIEKKIVEVSEYLKVVDAYGYKDRDGNLPSSFWTDLGVSNNADAWSAVKTASATLNRNDPFVLEFDVRNDKLVEVSMPLHYYGFEKVLGVPTFHDHNDANYIRIVQSAGYGVLDGVDYTDTSRLGYNQTLYLKQAPLMFLFEKDGMPDAKILTWADVNNSISTGVKLKPFGFEGNSDVRLALFCGATENIAKRDNKSGVVIGRGMSLDEAGEPCETIIVVGEGGETTYKLTDASATALGSSEYAFIRYTTGGLNSEADEINITAGSVIDLSAADITPDELNNFYVGTVSSVDDTRIGFDYDESKIFFLVRSKNTNPSYFERISSSRGTQFSAIKVSDINVGDKIAFYRTEEGIQFALVLERAE